ncbi:MAG: DUF3795 domain-containing protein, partial [Candidatus Peribacteraceae bacterium]|nr:DUF3795 domain-containing protein [Candidatus Peribacteraceae bacterium]
APCGMNCAICMAYLREKNTCPGCRKSDESKPKSCVSCIIKNCEHFKKTKSKFCYDCEKFPCTRMKQLDKRYRTKYDMSMFENLEFIKKHGIEKFLKAQEKKYKCSKCGGVICVHRKKCFKCGKSI